VLRHCVQFFCVVSLHGITVEGVELVQFVLCCGFSVFCGIAAADSVGSVLHVADNSHGRSLAALFCDFGDIVENMLYVSPALLYE
jgi:hypothetical protein